MTYGYGSSSIVVPNHFKLSLVIAFVAAGKYFRNLSRPSASSTSSRGNDLSLAVVRFITEESVVRKCPAALTRWNISAKNRGPGLFIESQQGIRKAAG